MSLQNPVSLAVRHHPCRRAALPMLACAMALMGCGGRHDDQTAALPSSAGTVWVVDSAADRRLAAAALLAFVSGTHAVLVDGDETYAGMRRTRGGKAPDGGQPLTIDGGIEATLVPHGEAMQLRFASGETVPLRRRAGGDAR